MASYSEAVSKTATLVAATADTVTLTGPYRKIQVINHDSTARISCRLGGTAVAAADEDDSYPVLPGGTTTLYDAADVGSSGSIAADAVVTLISAGTPTYTVLRF